MNTDAPVGVLDGYKVLDFTQYVAGPTVTLMMAEMGAEVIKVELAPGGDKTRLAPMQVNGRSGYTSSIIAARKASVSIPNPLRASRSSRPWWPR